MKVLFASGNPHIPQVRGGVEVNTHELANQLRERGIEPSVLAKLSIRDPAGMAQAVSMAVSGEASRVDYVPGYPVHRSRKPAGAVGGLSKVDVALVQNGGMIEIAESLARAGVPSIAYLHGLEFDQWGAEWRAHPKRLPFVSYIANSQFTADRFRRLYGLDAEIIPPLIQPELYRTPTSRREVTFINPVSVKGADLAAEIARLCPEIPFSFVRGWPLGIRQLWQLRRRLKSLPNVRLRRGVSDMKLVYRHTRVLLVPSQWEAETWGRVASEAQLSGIPVLASSRGGLPEAVGPGGTILRHDEAPEVWANAVRHLWHDEKFYEEKVQAAIRHSGREELDSESQLAKLVFILRRHARAGLQHEPA